LTIIPFNLEVLSHLLAGVITALSSRVSSILPLVLLVAFLAYEYGQSEATFVREVLQYSVALFLTALVMILIEVGG